MASEDEWIDIDAAAEREHYSPQSIRRRIKTGVLTARKEKSRGRDGRQVIKIWVRAAELNDAFGRSVRDEHVRRIRASAPPLTVEQKIATCKVILDHLLEREARR